MEQIPDTKQVNPDLLNDSSNSGDDEQNKFATGDLLGLVEVGSPNNNEGNMTEGFEVGADNRLNVTSNLSQRIKNADAMASETFYDENNHSLPPLTGPLHARSSSAFFDTIMRADRKLIFTIVFLVVAGILSITTALSLISNISLVPVGSSQGNALELTTMSSNREIHKFLSSIENNASGMSPSLVWLFGFPQSGTTHVLHLMHAVTMKATATNYGHTVMDPKGKVHVANHDSVQVYGDSGPALFTASVLDPPEKRILTWVSIDGACRNCHPRKYMYNYARFRELCWEGSVIKDGEEKLVEYDPSFVTSAVHLFRNPYDNIVLRFWAEREKMMEEKHNSWLQRYPSDHAGFQSWCNDRDAEWYDVELAWYGEEAMGLAEGVICRQEFYKYVMFHNNVLRTRLAFQLPTLILKYEDFHSRYETSIAKLAKFLDLPMESSPPTNTVEVGMSKHYFTDEHRQATNAFMRNLAMPKVADILKLYDTES